MLTSLKSKSLCWEVVRGLTQKDDYLEGEISGISAVNIPFWFKSFYKPGDKIAAIENWDDKIHKIAQLAPKWDIGSITGIPYLC